MRVAFLILRVSCYRSLGLLIESALARTDIEPLLVLGPSIDEASIKAYQSPTFDNIPQALQATRSLQPASFQEYLAIAVSVDVIVSIIGPVFYYESVIGRYPDLPRGGAGHQVKPDCRWAMVFDTSDSGFPSSDPTGADVVFWPTGNELAQSCRKHAEPWMGERLRQTARIVGYLRGDYFFRQEREWLCQQYGLDPSRPVVVWIPDNFVLKSDRLLVTPWFHYQWHEPSRFKRFYNALRYLRSPAAAVRALWSLGCDAGIGLALRRFCDRNNAQLVVVPRRAKDSPGDSRFTPNEKRFADCLLPEGESYPQAFMIGTAMAELMVCGYRTAGVVDAGAKGIPVLTVQVPEQAFSPTINDYHARFDQLFGQPGFHRFMTSEDFVRHFPAMKLKEFAPDPSAVLQFRDRHVGLCDGKVNHRILEQLLEFLPPEARQSV